VLDFIFPAAFALAMSCLVLLSLLLSSFPLCVLTIIEADSQLDNVNWMDGAPGVAMEYKVHVDSGKEDCYYQYVHEGATLYVSQQVLKGKC
jgi:hypothetical protein